MKSAAVRNTKPNEAIQNQSYRKDTVATILSIGFTALFMWWGMHFPALTPPSANADTFPINCLATPTPTPIADDTLLPPLTYAIPAPYPTDHPQLEILPQPYRNPNNAVMAWIQYGGVDASHKKPGVIVIHPTNWNAGRAEDVAGKAREISYAGFFAAAVYYELAPNDDIAKGYIPGQPSHELDGMDAGSWRSTILRTILRRCAPIRVATAGWELWAAPPGPLTP